MESSAPCHEMEPEPEEVTEAKGMDSTEKPTLTEASLGQDLESPCEEGDEDEEEYDDEEEEEEDEGEEEGEEEEEEEEARTEMDTGQQVDQGQETEAKNQGKVSTGEAEKQKVDNERAKEEQAQEGTVDRQGSDGMEEGAEGAYSPAPESEEGPSEELRKMRKTSSFMKTVRFRDPSETEPEEKRDSSVENLFPDYETEEWTSSSFEELFMAEDWINITDDRLLRKKIQEPSPAEAQSPAWGQEVTLRMQGVLEDRMVVEKDTKLVFVIGEGDVNQALEECAISMRKEEIALLLADSQYTYGLLGREPDIPAWAPLLYQLQLVAFRDKPDPLSLPVADRIRIGNDKRERGNFYFQREEYSMAARAYCMALDVLSTHTRGDECCQAGEEEEVNDQRVKCLNNLATAQLKLEQFDEALHTSRDVLFLDPLNVKALFRAGKLLSDRSEYEEAMELLKKALKLEPTTKAIHAELSKLVKRQSGGNETQKWKAKPAQVLGDNIAPFVIPPKKKPSGISWKFLLGALVVALGSLVTSVVLTARN